MKASRFNAWFGRAWLTLGYAFLFLPPERRAAITAFYAFCREVDDIADEEAPQVAALASPGRV